MGLDKIGRGLKDIFEFLFIMGLWCAGTVALLLPLALYAVAYRGLLRWLGFRWWESDLLRPWYVDVLLVGSFILSLVGLFCAGVGLYKLIGRLRRRKPQ